MKNNKLSINFSAKLDFKAVNKAVEPYILAICQRVLPEGYAEGNEYVSRNPNRYDQNLGSFKINLRTGRWADFACDDKGNDIVSLIAYIYSINNLQAANIVTSMIGGQQ